MLGYSVFTAPQPEHAELSEGRGDQLFGALQTSGAAAI
jgi:hypothetical protein